jgi:hypothetical protein
LYFAGREEKGDGSGKNEEGRWKTEDAKLRRSSIFLACFI